MMLNLPVEVIVSVTLASHCNSPELYISAMIDSIELLIDLDRFLSLILIGSSAVDLWFA